MKKRALAFFLTISLTAGMFVSCGKAGDGNTTKPTDSEYTASETLPSMAGADFAPADEDVTVLRPAYAYSSPDSKGAVLWHLKRGTVLRRIGTDPVWSKVILIDRDAYVRTEDLGASIPETGVSGETESTTDKKAPTAPETTPAPETPAPVTAAPTPAPATKPQAGGSPEAPTGEAGFATRPAFTGNLADISNKWEGWGYVTKDRDKYNRPNGALYYQKLYGYYADFIMPTSKKVYLTMDEGYENGYTPRILDILKEKKVHCTFFVTRPFARNNPDLMRRMIAEGHTIGNHTTTHPAGGIPKLGLQKETEDVMNCHNFVKENYGITMKYFRYPEGVFSKQSLALLHSLGYRCVFWSYAYADWNPDKQPDETYALNKALSEVHPGAIYLLHAVSKTNTDILARWIDGVRAKGFEFGVYPNP